jgi:hypothetical protein
VSRITTPIEEDLMRRTSLAIAAAALMMGALITAQTADAAATSHNTTTYTQTPKPAVQPLNCTGGTGGQGCGPGWIWRDGWRGWGCYPC